MHAIVMHRRGGPEVLSFETDFPQPAIGPDDVLVRVRACGLNRVDIFTREGQQGVRPPLPHILGMEVAGDVAAVGENVTGVAVGDRVLPPWWQRQGPRGRPRPRRRACRSGRRG